MGLFMKLSELCGTQEKVDVEQILEASIFIAMTDYVQELGGEENVSALQESIKSSFLAVNMYNNNLIKDVLSGFMK
jgi:hypothetical protein